MIGGDALFVKSLHFGEPDVAGSLRSIDAEFVGASLTVTRDWIWQTSLGQNQALWSFYIPLNPNYKISDDIAQSVFVGASVSCAISFS